MPVAGERSARSLRRRRRDRRRLGGVLPGPRLRRGRLGPGARTPRPAAPPGRRRLARADRARPRRRGEPRPAARSSPTSPRQWPTRDFVQESAPEDLELKRQLLAEIDAATPAGVVIASSTSGYGMSEMQVACAHPERTRRRAPVQPAVPDPAGRGRRRRSRPRPRRSRGPPTSSGTSASR